MSRFTAASRLPFALGTLSCAILASTAVADEHAGHSNELSPLVITAIAPSSPLTIVTNPKDPRQPVPASDHHAIWEKCGYCTLLFSCPALPGTPGLTLYNSPEPRSYLAANPRLGHARQPVFPGSRSRAPPVFL